jgi:hypothetical protein
MDNISKKWTGRLRTVTLSSLLALGMGAVVSGWSPTIIGHVSCDRNTVASRGAVTNAYCLGAALCRVNPETFPPRFQVDYAIWAKTTPWACYNGSTNHHAQVSKVDDRKMAASQSIYSTPTPMPSRRLRRI